MNEGFSWPLETITLHLEKKPELVCIILHNNSNYKEAQANIGIFVIHTQNTITQYITYIQVY